MSRCYDDMFRDEIVELLETAQAESDRRLGMLIRADAYYRHNGDCPSCEMIFENVYRHADGCELDAECNG